MSSAQLHRLALLCCYCCRSMGHLNCLVHLLQVEIVHAKSSKSSIGDAVVRRATALDACAVVMAKHSRSGLREWFMGSVSKYCLGSDSLKQALIITH